MKVEQQNALYTYKIVLLGAGGVGKTCLFNRYCFNSFNLNTLMTIGVNFHSNYLKIQFNNDPSKKKKEYYVVNAIFDFGGQERFKPMIPQFLEGTSGALLIFDLVSYPSFEQLDYWCDLLEENAENPIPKLLIGSKCDLLDQVAKEEIVNKDLILGYLKRRKIDRFYQTSALTNYNVLDVFEELTNLMLKYNKVNAHVI